MKIGDLVRLRLVEGVNEPVVTQQCWRVKNIKSDSRAIWVQFVDDPADVWSNSQLYEVISEGR